MTAPHRPRRPTRVRRRDKRRKVENEFVESRPAGRIHRPRIEWRGAASMGHPLMARRTAEYGEITGPASEREDWQI